MVAIVGTIIALALCLMFGQFSFALLLSGILCLVGIMVRSAQPMACFIFITAISLSFMVASNTDWAFLVPPLILWLTKEAIAEYALPKHLWVLLLPVALFSLDFQDRDLKAAILVLFVLTLPNAIGTRLFTHTMGTYFKHGLAILVLLISGVAFSLLSMPRYTGKVAIIEAGVWARTEKQFADINDLNIESAYSYSEFKRLIGADVIKPMALNESYAEAWLITPTKPLEKKSIDKLWDWVKNGGRLIVATDHTDMFGHAKVVNAFLSGRRLHTSLTAFFPLDANMKAEANWGENAWLKTTNVESGLFMWPQFTARWVNETADYSNKNFFGPLSLTADDKLGRRIISGTTSFGRGRVILFGDSTSFANFTLYQPHIIPLIERIRSGSNFACMVPAIWIVIILSFISLFFTKKFNMVLIIPILGLLAFFDQSRIPVEWKNYAYWTGDEKAVMEFGTPGDRLSTVYAISILSGQKPRWISSYDHHMGGFWVSKTSPPNNNWRWIDNSYADVRVESYDHRFDPLLNRISKGKPQLWPLQSDPSHIKTGNIWTDDAVGDWWFDRGISKAKQKRIQAWIAWLSNQVPPSYPVPVSVKTKLKEYKLRIDGRDWETVVIPELPLRQDEEIYLGRGISATLVNIEGQPMFLGTRAFTEAWDCVNAWVVVPNLSEKSDTNVIK